MKRKIIILYSIIMVFMLIGCNSSKKELLTNKIDVKEIDRILIVFAGGNPEYGHKSKTITNQEEIKELVDIFNGCLVGKRVSEGDVVIANTSNYYFYQGDKLIQLITFNGNDSKRVWIDSMYYYVNYLNKSPYELFQESNADIVIIDDDLNEMKTPKE